MMQETNIYFQALQLKYAQERDKRLQHGARKYADVVGPLAHFLDDPVIEGRVAREPITESIDVLIIGAGICGICTAARLREAGIHSIRIVDKGGDFGGTWYWNRYPGAACDVEAHIYLPLLEKTQYVPPQKYATANEIFAYLGMLGRHYGLHERACFRTKVTELRWQEQNHCWISTTDRADKFKARFVCVATGGVANPKIPAIPSIATFTGRSFHTSRWDYGYTGGDSRGNLLSLRDKRVAIIGTGASAVQVIPHLGQWSEHLYVFQRTPSAVDVRANSPTDARWAQTLQPGWQQHRMRNFEEALLGLLKEDDLVADGWTDISRRLRNVGNSSQPGDETPKTPEYIWQLADFKRMEELRRRIDNIVRCPATAAALKPYYNTYCKRPCFHDEYLKTYNRPNVTLVDTNGQGVERISTRGLVVDGKEYQVDCIVFSTGFEVAAMAYRAGQFTAYGVGGISLEEKWSHGYGSLHGMLTHNFPNMVMVGGLLDGPASVNGTYVFDGQSQHVARILQRVCNDGVTRFEVTQAAEDRWAGIKLEKRSPTDVKFLRDCTPGYANGDGGAASVESIAAALYRGGTLDYFNTLDSWFDSQFYDDMCLSI